MFRLAAILLLMCAALAVVNDAAGEPLEVSAPAGHMDNCLCCACCVVATDVATLVRTDEATPLHATRPPSIVDPDSVPAFPPPRV